MITQLLGDIYAYHPNSGVTRYSNRLVLSHPSPPQISDELEIRGMASARELNERGRLYRLVHIPDDPDTTNVDEFGGGRIQTDFLVNNRWDDPSALPIYYEFAAGQLPRNAVSLAVQNSIFYVCYLDSTDDLYKVQEFHIGGISATSTETQIRRELVSQTVYTFPADVEVQALTLQNGTFLIVGVVFDDVFGRIFGIHRFRQEGTNTTLSSTATGSRIPILPVPTVPVNGITLLSDGRYAISDSAGSIQFYKNVVHSWGVSSARQYQVLADEATGFYSTGIIPNVSPPERDENAFNEQFRRIPTEGYNGPIGDAILTHNNVTRTFSLQKHASGTSILKQKRTGHGVYTSDGQWDLSRLTFANVVAFSADIHITDDEPEYYLMLRNGTVQIYREVSNALVLNRTLTLSGSFSNATDMVRYDQQFWVLDAGENKVNAFDDSGNTVDNDSFELHPSNQHPSCLCRGIGNEHWYVGNLDPAGFFVYYAVLVAAEISGVVNRDEELMESVEFTWVGTATGEPTPTVSSQVTEGTLPDGLVLDGLSLTGTPTNIPDAGARFAVAYTARNSAGEDTDTVQYRVFNQKWLPDATYSFSIPGPSKVDISLDATYLSGVDSVQAVALPNWLTLDTSARRLSGTLPVDASSTTAATAKIRANGTDGGTAEQDFTFTRSGTMYALDFGMHNPGGTILSINMSDGTTQSIVTPVSTSNEDWRSLAAHDGYLWSINNNTEILTRIELDNSLLPPIVGATITTVGTSIGSGNWQGLVWHNDRFYLINDTDNSLHSVPDTGGATTRIGVIDIHRGHQLVSLASYGDDLYVIDNQYRKEEPSALYRINPQTAKSTKVADLAQIDVVGVTARYYGNWRALTSDNQTLYLLDNRLDYLFTLDPTTGTRTLISPTTSGPLGWQGLAWLPASSS